jgi:hypothetical protein
MIVLGMSSMCDNRSLHEQSVSETYAIFRTEHLLEHELWAVLQNKKNVRFKNEGAF